MSRAKVSSVTSALVDELDAALARIWLVDGDHLSPLRQDDRRDHRARGARQLLLRYRSNMRLVGCGFGGVGPVLPPGVPNAWVIALVEIDGAAEIASITLVDADDRPFARAVAPFDVRVVQKPRSAWDFSEDGTVPYDGTVTPGKPLLLRVHATLDSRAEVVYAKSSRGARAVVEASGSSVSGVASPWATA